MNRNPLSILCVIAMCTFSALAGLGIEPLMTQAIAAVAASGATITPGVGSLVDASGNTWIINTGRQIVLNSTVQLNTSQVTLMLYFNGVIYQRANKDDGSLKGWWKWENSGWIAVAGDPRPAAAPAQVVLTRTSGGSIKDAAGNVWTLDSAGSIRMNGNAVAGGGGTSSLTYVSSTNTIWGQDASSGGWYSWNGSTWIGPSSTSPVSAPASTPAPTAAPTPSATLAPITPAVNNPPTGNGTLGGWQMANLGGMDYGLLLPAGYSAQYKYPVVLFLHQFQNGSQIPSPQLDPWFNTSGFRSNYPAIVIAPRCLNNNDNINWGGVTSGPTACEQQALAIVKKVAGQYSANLNRVYVTGDSMGGLGTWDMMIRYNIYNGTEDKVFAAGLSLAGATYNHGYPTPDPAVVNQFRTAPVWAVHGSNDTSVPLDWDRNMNAALRGTANFKYTEMAGYGHDVWDDFYPAYSNWAPWLFGKSAAGPVAPANSPKVSANGATATPGNGTLVDNGLNLWTVTSGGVVQVNGANAAFSANVTMILWYNNAIYQTASGGWWMWNGSDWPKVAGDPRPAPTTPPPSSGTSANGATATPGSGTLNDQALNKWTVTAAGVVQKNGANAGYSANVTMILWYNNAIYQTAPGGWWMWSGSDWTQVSGDPRPGSGTTPPPSSGACTAIGQGGCLLPAGYLRTNGSQIVDENNNAVRISSVGYWMENPAADMPRIKAAGFNTVRVAFVNGSKAANLARIDETVKAAAAQGIKVIIDNHSNEGGAGSDGQWHCASQQRNGLWYDVGGASDNTDGCGTAGHTTDASWVSDWVEVANRYKNNTTVIGYDLRNEPLSYPGMSTWEAGSANPTHNLRYAYERAGNAIQAVDSGKLIICEGPQNYNGNFAGTGPAVWGDLTLASKLPVNLKVPNKVVYSVHDYPTYVAGYQPDSGDAKVQQMNKVWGYLVTQNIAPVWVGEMGANFDGSYNGENIAGSKAWAQTLVDYMNGKYSASGGPSVGAGKKGVPGSWWMWGSYPTYQLTGTQNPDGSLKQAQLAYYGQVNH